jgi:uncharacterized membrane protein
MTRFEACAPGALRCEIGPNRSASWRELRACILAVAVVSTAIGVFFALRGAWPVAPFAGLEALAVAAGLYACARAAYRCEVVRVEGPDVLIGRGVGTPGQWVRFPRAFARVRFEPPRGRMPGRLSVGASGRYVEIGTFLSEPERRELARRLAQELRGGAAY